MKDGKIYPSGNPCWGDGDSVDVPKPFCEKGTFVGNIHSHREPHIDQRSPFNRGLTNIDFFNLIQDGLTNKIIFPYIACIISPDIDEKGDVNGIRIDCEQYNKFDEDDIKNIKINIKINGNNFLQKFSDNEINFIKECEPPRNNFLWYTVLATLKKQMKIKGLMKQDSIIIRLKIEKGKVIFSEPNKNKLNFY